MPNDDGSVTVVKKPFHSQDIDAHVTASVDAQSGKAKVDAQLHDKVVREYAPDGKIVWEFKTPDDPKEAWPFTAIRLPSGNTLVDLTHSNMSVEVDPSGKVVWQLTNPLNTIRKLPIDARYRATGKHERRRTLK